MQTADDNVGDHKTEIAVLKAKVKLLTWFMREHVVTKAAFEPVKMISYGFAGIVISSVLIAVLTYVLKKSAS